MKFQWSLLLGLFLALVIAIFAVANVASVTVNYIIGVREIPLILIIIGSALLGGLIVGMFGIFRQYKSQWKVRKLQKEIDQMNMQLETTDVKDQLLPLSSTGEVEEEREEIDTKEDGNKTQS